MMKKKVWLVLLAAVLVFGFAVFGCSSPSDDDPPAPTTPTDPNTPDGPQHFETTGPIIPTLWGNNKPTITADGTMSITASGSTGFIIKFADIGYTFNREDALVFTYEITVTTPAAAITAKKVNGDNVEEFAGDSDWGQGKGREYVLGHDTLSVYSGPKVAGTWDAATKTGTFEVLMKYLAAGATAIGFQHNFWCDMGSTTKIAENSVYTLKITKIANKAGEAPPPPPPPTGSEWFDNAVAIKVGIGKYGSGAHEFDEETGILTITGNGGFSVPLPTGFTVADTVSIKYACLNVSEDPEAQVKFISKQDNGWTDVSPAAYPQLNTTEVSTLTVKGFSAAGVAAGKAFFQTNGTFKAKIKIIEITRIVGDPIKITLPVSGAGLKPAAGEEPVTTVDTAQYAGTVSWAPAVASGATFVNGTSYTATISLTAKTGYTFAGVAANSLSVVGASEGGVTHAAGTGTTLTITAVFPTATAPAPDKPITFATGDVKNFNGTITQEADGSGFTITQTQGYDWAYAYFKVTFAAGYKLSDYAFIELTFTLINTSYKPLCVAAYEVGATEPTGQMPGSAIIAGDTSTNVAINQDTAYPLVLPITVESVDGNSVWIAIRSHAASGGSYKITDITFHNTAPVAP